MQRNHYHLPIVTSVIVLLSIASLVVFSPGYLEYQQIRWRAKISPKQIETGMTGMLAATKATEEILGHGELTADHFHVVSADMLRGFQKIAEYNDLAMVLRVGYLGLIRDDPSGEDLKQRLSGEIANDVAERIKDDSDLSKNLRLSAYAFAISDSKFKDLLEEKIGSLDILELSQEQRTAIEEDEQGGDGDAEEAF